jgi:putative addiction module component (TIGR02574 family)
VNLADEEHIGSGWTSPGRGHRFGVVTRFENIREKALSLNPGERTRLAVRLLESVEPDSREEVEHAWESQIQRRIGKIDSGKAAGRSWDEIKRAFDTRYRR